VSFENNLRGAGGKASGGFPPDALSDCRRYFFHLPKKLLELRNQELRGKRVGVIHSPIMQPKAPAFGSGDVGYGLLLALNPDVKDRGTHPACLRWWITA